MNFSKLNISQRLMQKVVKNNNGCWTWVGGKSGKSSGDYGVMVLEGKRKRAHRISYEHFVGKIPDGLEIDHLCHNTLCINPKHLEPVTHAENMKRRKDKGLPNCKHGHLYTEETTYINCRGRRECQVCRDLHNDICYKKQPKKNCLECGKEISYMATHCMSCKQIGDKNPYWKGGITKNNCVIV